MTLVKLITLDTGCVDSQPLFGLIYFSVNASMVTYLLMLFVFFCSCLNCRLIYVCCPFWLIHTESEYMIYAYSKTVIILLLPCGKVLPVEKHVLFMYCYVVLLSNKD